MTRAGDRRTIDGVGSREGERPVLGEAIGDLLASAVGVALSPIPIVAVILMLGTRRAHSTGTAFATGWVLGLVAVSVIVLLAPEMPIRATTPARPSTSSSSYSGCSCSPWR